jgi:HAAS domain-containing protein
MDERDLIDAYLDRLFAQLRGSGTEVRRILTETEQHLREAATALEAHGADPLDAQKEAIRRFGKPRELAGDFRRMHGLLPSLPTLAQLTEKLAFLAVIGLIAIGISGGVAALFGSVFGKPFVSGDAPGVVYTQARCADYLEYHPEAGTCARAAVAHHFDEVVWYRIDAGILGLLGLIAFFAIRRFNRKRFRGRAAIPDGFTGIVGAALFGMAAAGLLGLGVLSAIFGQSNGAGDYISGGVVSLVAFAGFGLALLRTLRERERTAEPPDATPTDDL